VAGGTFSSSLDLNLNITFDPTNGGAAIGAELENLTLTGSGNWGPTPPAGATLVPGALGDLDANLHDGLPTADEVDFFVKPDIFTCGPPCNFPQAPNVAAFNDDLGPAIPEPASLTLLGTGIIALAAARRRRRRRGG
jgi:hypothetical protein